MYYPRYIEEQFLDSVNNIDVVLVNGPRRAGKSTFVKTVLKNTHRYYFLDDETTLTQCQSDPYSFFQEKSIIVGEIQRVPKLFITIKQVVGQESQVDEVLTGSVNTLLSESLARRMEIFVGRGSCYTAKRKWKGQTFPQLDFIFFPHPLLFFLFSLWIRV